MKKPEREILAKMVAILKKNEDVGMDHIQDMADLAVIHDGGNVYDDVEAAIKMTMKAHKDGVPIIKVPFDYCVLYFAQNTDDLMKKLEYVESLL